MRPFVTSVVTRAPAWKFVALLTAAMLQACGGGGGGDTPPAPTDDATTSSLSLPRASHFAVTQTTARQSLNGDSGVDVQSLTTLLLIDKRTNTVADKLELDEVSYYGMGGPYSMGRFSGQWLVSYGVQRDTVQRTATILGTSQLFYVKGGNLMQMDLSGDTPGTPRKISTLKICGIGWEMLQLNDEGSDGWLPVSAADPATGLCTDPNKLKNHLVPLGTLSTANTIDLPADKEWIATPMDAQGKPLGVLVADRSGAAIQLLLINHLDMQTRLQTISLGADAPASIGGFVRAIGPVAGSTQQYLMQIGKTIRKVDWRSGRIAVGGTLLALEGNYPSGFNGNGSHVYIADGCRLHQIDSAGNIRLLSTLPGAGGQIQQIELGTNHIVVTQHQPSRGPNFEIVAAPGCEKGPENSYTTSLHAVNPSSGAFKALIPIQDESWIGILGIAGNEALVSRNRSSSDSIERLNLDTGAINIVEEHIDLLSYWGISGRRQPMFDTDIQDHQLMWCKLQRADSYNCEAGDKIISYVIATGQQIVLGVMPSLQNKLPEFPAGEFSFTNTYIYPSYELWIGEAGLLDFQIHQSGTAGSLSLNLPWMVTPGVANSLLEIPGAWPDQR